MRNHILRDAAALTCLLFSSACGMMGGGEDLLHEMRVVEFAGEDAVVAVYMADPHTAERHLRHAATGKAEHLAEGHARVMVHVYFDEAFANLMVPDDVDEFYTEIDFADFLENMLQEGVIVGGATLFLERAGQPEWTFTPPARVGARGIAVPI